MNSAPATLTRPWRLVIAPASAVALLAGLLNAFTVNLVGAMPVSEIVLIGVFSFALLTILLRKRWPADIFHDRLFLVFIAAQAIALTAYICSDIYRGSSPRDMARGWARMIFLGIDLVAVAWLVSRSPRNFLLLLFGNLIGEALSALFLGALYGDYWKFGYGSLATYLFLLAGAGAGAIPAVIAASGAAILNLAMDFRSLGLLSLLVAALGIVQAAPRRLRLWIAVPSAIVGLTLVAVLYQHMTTGKNAARGERSTLSRFSMVQAATEAFIESPLIGNGSWFSNTKVFDNFMAIRAHAASIAHIGGFPEANEEPGTVALHCQLLVAVAEGGIFGGAFFFVFTGALLWALAHCVFIREWSPLSPIYLMALLVALFNVALSPFSGAHRVLIATAVGLILLLRRETREARDTFVP